MDYASNGELRLIRDASHTQTVSEAFGIAGVFEPMPIGDASDSERIPISRPYTTFVAGLDRFDYPFDIDFAPQEPISGEQEPQGPSVLRVKPGSLLE